MCGISGITDLQQNIGPDVIHKMVNALLHRGPDGHAVQKLNGAWFGHDRLSIIDLVSGDQPMSDPTGRWWIVFNGEVYNYRELGKWLETKGVVFHTKSDTEVILLGYVTIGEDIVTRLNGQFSFAIWDNQEKILFAARDRFGEKPFYWAASNQGDFLFASEIKSLLASEQFTPKLDPEAVDLYLALYHVPPGRTIYSNVHTLPSAHTLTWRQGQVQTRRYWQPQFSTQTTLTEQEAIEQVGGLIRNAVRRQMVADVPVGAFLSGGLDSSTVVAHMAEVSERPVITFSVGFGELINELPYAREVAQRYQTDHYEIQMDISVGEMLERMSVVYDEPFADSSNIPTYLLAGFASKHVKVCLSGDGGDEIFGGYGWYPPLLEDAASNNHTLMHLLKYALNFGRQKSKVWERRIRIGTLLSTDRSRLWGNSHISTETLRSLHREYYPDSHLQGMDPATEFDLRCYLPGDILVKVDRAGMAHGLESRAPFLDAELAEFVLGLPWRLRFKDGKNLKYLLRASSQHLWSKNIQKRTKQGFGAPIDSWLAREDVKTLEQQILLPASPLLHLLPALSHEVYYKASSAQKWTLLCLGLWLNHHTNSL